MTEFRDTSDQLRHVGNNRVDQTAFSQRKVERKPDGAPKSRDKYKEIEEKKSKKNVAGSAAARTTPGAGKAKSTGSIFDLSAASNSGKAGPLSSEGDSSAEVPKMPGEAALLASASKFLENMPTDALMAKEGAGKQSMFQQSSDDAPEAPVQQFVAPLEPQASPVAEAKPIPKAQMQELVDQIISKLYTLESSGKTDTTIVLQHPPILKGATVKITSFDSARGELNIAFHNLTQSAKATLDLPVNAEALRHNLDAKGITVHIFSTSTFEDREAVAGIADPYSREEQGEESANRQQGEQEEDEQS